LKNFKSFKDVEINMQSKKKDSKPLVVVYGINGSGKTTISQAFLTLKRTMETMQYKVLLKDLLDEKITPPEEVPLKPEIMLQILKSQFSKNGVESIIDEYKMIDSGENLSLEFEFMINGNPGSYYIEMDSSNIVKERLEYKLSKNRGCYFHIDEDEVHINDRIFESKEFWDNMYNQVQMYWGKHSFLSILVYEMMDKSDTYINSNISMSLMDLLLAFEQVNYKVKQTPDGESISLGTEDRILANLVNGTIDKKSLNHLTEVEEVLNNFFVSLFDDVIKAYYKTVEEKGHVKYNLYLKKQIENHIFDIDFHLESNGTQEILGLVPYLMLAISGKCVVIDEYGIGIHDLLAAKLIAAVSDQIKGQLIITTHNTMIMDQANLKPESLYFIMNDKTLRKSVKCVTEVEKRLHPNYNYRNRYLSNSLYEDSLPKVKGNIEVKGLAELYK